MHLETATGCSGVKRSDTCVCAWAWTRVLACGIMLKYPIEFVCFNGFFFLNLTGGGGTKVREIKRSRQTNTRNRKYKNRCRLAQPERLAPRMCCKIQMSECWGYGNRLPCADLPAVTIWTLRFPASMEGLSLSLCLSLYQCLHEMLLHFSFAHIGTLQCLCSHPGLFWDGWE